ncbi:MAG: sensor histidine kinase [Rhodospirillales bacterium]
MTTEKSGSAVTNEPFDLTLLSNFIHQVVNPLNGVAGTLDNLAEGKIKGEARQIQRLQAARSQLEQCISLVRNLAFFAQGFAALEPEERRLVIIPQIIIEAAQFFQEAAARKKILIVLEDRKTQNKTLGHRELIRQVFMNLFDNAVKYASHGSKVIVDQRIQHKTGNILITVNTQSDHPLDSADLIHIFELGFRGKNAKKIVASGTGLGLYICKRIVHDVHEGKIWADSARSGNVIFYISFVPAS